MNLSNAGTDADASVFAFFILMKNIACIKISQKGIYINVILRWLNI